MWKKEVFVVVFEIVKIFCKERGRCEVIFFWVVSFGGRLGRLVLCRFIGGCWVRGEEFRIVWAWRVREVLYFSFRGFKSFFGWLCLVSCI